MTAKTKPKKSAKPESRAAATYLYALLSRESAPPLKGFPKGLPKLGSVRALDAGDGLWVLAASAPLSVYDTESLQKQAADANWIGERAEAHDDVITHAFKLGTLIPLPLFTLLDTDARALAHVKRSRDELDEVLARIDGCEEWSLQVTFKDEVTRASTKRAKKLFEDLGDVVEDARRRPEDDAEIDPHVVLEAAFLVRKTSAESFHAAIARAAKTMIGEGFELALGGPFPTAHFIGEGALTHLVQFNPDAGGGASSTSFIV